MRTVWVDAWQLRCCGQPIEVGTHVRWRLEKPDDDIIIAVLGNEIAGSITDAEEHHHDAQDVGPRTDGMVTSIRAVWCRYELHGGAVGKVLYPRPGSAQIRQLRSADGREAEDDDLRLVAYLVELDEADAELRDA